MPRRPKPPEPQRRRRGSGSVRLHPSGRWEAREPGTRRSTYHDSRAAAERHLAALAQARDLARATPGRTEQLGAYLERWFARREPTWSASRIVQAQQMLRAVLPLSELALGELRPDLVGDWVAGELRRGSAPGTIRNRHALLRAALAELVPDVLPTNPAGRRLVLPREQDRGPAHFEELEARRFLRAAEATPCAVLFVLLLGTGLRLGEALGLRWSDLDLDAACLEVTGSWDKHAGRRGATKTGRGRHITLSPPVLAALGTLERTAGYLFPGRAGAPMTPQSVGWWFKVAARAAGVPLLSPHALRHTYATIALARGVAVADVARSLGHSTPTTTMRTYAHSLRARDGAAERAVASLFAGV